MKILVTNSHSFLGSHLVDALVEEKHEVLGCLKKGGRFKSGDYNQSACYKELEPGTREYPSIFAGFKPDYIIHNYVDPDISNPLREVKNTFEDYLTETIDLLESARQHGTQKILINLFQGYYTGNSEMDNKYKIYNESKRAIQGYIKLYCRAYGLNYALIRVPNLFGPRARDGVVYNFIHNILNHKTLNITDAVQREREFVYVKDVVKANIQTLQKFQDSIIDIISTEKITLSGLATLISAIAGQKITPAYRPSTLHITRNTDIPADYLYYSEYGLETSLRETYEYYKELHDVKQGEKG